MLLQAVVDHNHLFRNLCIGWPGSVHDAIVLANSSLFRKVNSGELLVGDSIQVYGHDLPPFLLGDSAYPLTLADKTVLVLLSDISAKVMRLQTIMCKGCCWSSIWTAKGTMAQVVKANRTTCDRCLLCVHNLCEIHQDTFDNDWLQEAQLDQPDSVPQSATQTSSGCTRGEEVREILMEYFQP